MRKTEVPDSYLITTTDFALSDRGIHLLRNGFNYRTMDYSDIRDLTIT